MTDEVRYRYEYSCRTLDEADLAGYYKRIYTVLCAKTLVLNSSSFRDSDGS